MTEGEEIIGVIYPLPEHIHKHMFSQKRDIYVKYLPHVPTKRSKIKIKPGMKLFIYESGGRKVIVGDAIIQSIEYLLISEVLQKYKNRIMAPPDDLKEYSKGRESKKAMVLTLTDIKALAKPMKCDLPITMAGMYFTEKIQKEMGR